MDCDKYKEWAGRFIDGELTKEKESLLFSHLSECGECREYFKSLNVIRQSISHEEFPDELEDRIFTAIRTKKSPKSIPIFGKNIFPAFAYAVSILLIALSIILYNRANNYKEQTVLVKNIVRQQNSTIEMLYNSLPTTVIRAKNTSEIIVKPRM